MSKNKDKYDVTDEISVIRHVLKAYKGMRKVKDVSDFYYHINGMPFLDKQQKSVVQEAVRLFDVIEKQAEGLITHRFEAPPTSYDPDDVPF